MSEIVVVEKSTNPADLERTAQKQLARARERYRALLAEWDQIGRRVIHTDEIDRAHEELCACESRFWQAGNSEFWDRQQELNALQIVTYWRRLIGVGGIPAGPLAALYSLIVTALGSGVLLLLISRPTPILVILMLLFIFTFAIAYAMLVSPEIRSFVDKYHELNSWIDDRKAQIYEAKAGCEDCEERMNRLVYLFDLPKQIEAAKKRMEARRDVLASRRFQLAITNYRVMRGTEFEEFVAEIFRELGHQVELTKGSGDHGTDLIVTLNDKRLCIQVKGWNGSVGNYAIQEAFFGMKFYDCHACMVVTNSTFTRSARVAAERASVQLIDGSMIIELLEGRVELL